MSTGRLGHARGAAAWTRKRDERRCAWELHVDMGPCLEIAERRVCVRTKQDECRDWLDCSGRVSLGTLLALSCWRLGLRCALFRRVPPLICYCSSNPLNSDFDTFPRDTACGTLVS